MKKLILSITLFFTFTVFINVNVSANEGDITEYQEPSVRLYSPVDDEYGNPYIPIYNYKRIHAGYGTTGYIQFIDYYLSTSFYSQGEYTGTIETSKLNENAYYHIITPDLYPNDPAKQPRLYVAYLNDSTGLYHSYAVDVFNDKENDLMDYGWEAFVYPNDLPLPTFSYDSSHYQLYIRYETPLIDEDSYLAGYSEGEYSGFIAGKAEGLSEGEDIGYQRGLDEAEEVLRPSIYLEGYNHGMSLNNEEIYQEGYNEGAEESFLGNFDTWIVPAIIVVMFVGGFFAIARKKRDGDF